MATNRYLSQDDVASRLRAGRSVEQWLSHLIEGNDRVIRWLRIDREPQGTFSATCFEVFDEGDLEHLDIYEFSTVNLDEPFGDVKSFPDACDAVQHSISKLSAHPDRFVPAGMIQAEYEAFLRAEGEWRREVGP